MDLTFEKSLVTGGAGFIGSHLVEALVAKGGTVSVLDNLTTGSRANLAKVEEQIVFHKGDIRDLHLLNEVSKGCEIIFHLAAEVSVPRTIEDPVESTMINVMGTLSVLEAARKNKVKRVVLSSSCAVYGEGAQGPKQEGMSPEPLSPYAVQKLTGEFYARLYYELYGTETVCLRYFNVYGPRQDPSSAYSGVISIFLNRALSAQEPRIYGDGNQYRDFVFVEDVVRSNLLAGKSDWAVGRIFNIGTGKFIRVNQLWEIISQQSAINIRPDYQPPRIGDIVESVAGIEHARQRLGFEADYPFEEGIRITLDWYRSQSKNRK
jgi:UDP-glucose 4-epimerase